MNGSRWPAEGGQGRFRKPKRGDWDRKKGNEEKGEDNRQDRLVYRYSRQEEGGDSGMAGRGPVRFCIMSTTEHHRNHHQNDPVPPGWRRPWRAAWIEDITANDVRIDLTRLTTAGPLAHCWGRTCGWTWLRDGTTVHCGGPPIGTIGLLGPLGPGRDSGWDWGRWGCIPSGCSKRAPRVTAEPEPQRQRTDGETWPVRYPVRSSVVLHLPEHE